MRFSIKLGLFLALVPGSIAAVEVHSDLPLISMRYAEPEPCEKLQAMEKRGEAPTLHTAQWHLTPSGFSDAYEVGCTLEAVFLRDKRATATAICTYGAETEIRHYHFQQSDEKKQNPDLYVFDNSDEGRLGFTYQACPVLKKQ